MDTTKVIVTLLILTIVLSVATVAFNVLAGDKITLRDDSKRADVATVSFEVECRIPSVADKASVGLYVEGTPITP